MSLKLALTSVNCIAHFLILAFSLHKPALIAALFRLESHMYCLDLGSNCKFTFFNYIAADEGEIKISWRQTDRVKWRGNLFHTYYVYIDTCTVYFQRGGKDRLERRPRSTDVITGCKNL